MSRRRLAFHDWPAAVYAIGDVHGCFEQMVALEQMIVEDALDLEGEKWLLTVGDHIDRGPRSAAAVERAMGPAPKGFRRFSLIGNHEQMLLDFFDNPSAHVYWLEQGGIETLASYGIRVPYPPLRAHEPVRALLGEQFPADHLRFLSELPVCLSLPGWVFVHAGIRPGVPLAQQTDDDMIWIRDPFLSSQLTGGLRVVHGHTPARDIVVTPHRIGIDTHCYKTGRLSAVRVTPDGGTRFFTVGA